MTLTFAESNEPLWLKLKEHFTAERDKYRIKNDSLTNTELDTVTYRAHIRLLNTFIDLDKPFRDKEKQ